MDITLLPTVNAALNLAAACFLVAGYRFIKQGRMEPHRVCMLSAFGCSVLFLVSYLVYHAQVGSRRFEGDGIVRLFYLGVLLTHTVLAAAVPPLAIVTLSRALKGRFAKHRAIARWTWPIWMYVSITGVIVYAMLYHLY
jgi:uncharacterized membrane protein YozB (DUF420 family)